LTELARGRQRCYLVYAVAPDGVSAREANDRLNKAEGYGGRTLEQLRSDEPEDERFWWRRRR
jgi:hypothetical protein